MFCFLAISIAFLFYFSFNLENIVLVVVFSSLSLVIYKGWGLVPIILGLLFYMMIYFIMPLWLSQANVIDNEEFYVWEVKEKYSILQKGINKYVYFQKSKIDYGDLISGNYSLNNLRSPKNRSSFDFSKYLMSKGVHREVVFNKDIPIKIEKGFKLLRGNIHEYLSNISNEGAKSLFATMLFNFSGNSSLFDDTRELGIVHLVVVSGFHIQIFLFAIKKLLGKVLKTRVIHMISFAIIVVFCFALNFSISVVRILIMNIIVFMFSFSKNKKIKSKHALLLAGIIHLMVFPALSTQLTFFLSYMVTYSLLITRRKKSKKKKNNFLLDYLRSSVVAYIITFPFVISMNYEVNILSLLVQVLITPFFVVLYPLLFILLLIPQTYDFVELINSSSETLFAILNERSITLVFGKIPYWLLLLTMVQHFAFVNMLKIKMNGFTSFYLIHLCLYWTIVYFWRTLDFFTHVEFINVGNALAVLIRLPFNKGTFLFDAPSKNNLSVREVIPYLKSKQVRNIDIIFISHDDNDHSGGEKDIIKEMSIGRIYYSESRFDEIIFNNDVSFTNLNKDFLREWGDNDKSLLISVRIKKRRFLFTGDIEKEAEKRFCNLKKEKFDIVSVPHHGSNSSSSECFTNWAKTKYAASSNSSQFGFPKKEVMERWEENGAIFLSTLYEGSIDFMYSDLGSYIDKDKSLLFSKID